MTVTWALQRVGGLHQDVCVRFLHNPALLVLTEKSLSPYIPAYLTGILHVGKYGGDSLQEIGGMSVLGFKHLPRW